jgi:hypothetical protein
MLLLQHLHYISSNDLTSFDDYLFLFQVIISPDIHMTDPSVSEHTQLSHLVPIARIETHQSITQTPENQEQNNEIFFIHQTRMPQGQHETAW